MHALTSIYDRWRAKVHSILSEANPEGSAVSHLPLPSSSFRSQQPQQAMSYEELAALHSEDPDVVTSIPSRVSEPQGPHKESSSSVTRSIPKGIPKADYQHNSVDENHSTARNSGLAQDLTGMPTDGFLNFVGEDEDNLALQKQREEEEQKAEETAQGHSDIFLLFLFTSVLSVILCRTLLLRRKAGMQISRQANATSSWVCIAR